MRAENPGNAGVRPEVLDGAERERERERCVSDADASSYGPFRARNDPQHICPERTHANTTPHHLTRSLSTTSPAARAQANPDDRPKPSPISKAPLNHGNTTTNNYIHKPLLIASPNHQPTQKPQHKAKQQHPPKQPQDNGPRPTHPPAKRIAAGETSAPHAKIPAMTTKERLHAL